MLPQNLVSWETLRSSLNPDSIPRVCGTHLKARFSIGLYKGQYNVPCRLAIEDPDEAARKTTPEQPQLLLQLNRYSWKPGRWGGGKAGMCRWHLSGGRGSCVASEASGGEERCPQGLGAGSAWNSIIF
jgi:hypothetical protein